MHLLFWVKFELNCILEVTCVHDKLLQSCLTQCNSKDCSLPGPSRHGMLQARIMKWVAMSSSRGSSWPRDGTHISYFLHWQAGSLLLTPPREPRSHATVETLQNKIFILLSNFLYYLIILFAKVSFPKR